MTNVLDLASRYVNPKKTGKRYSSACPSCGGGKNSTKFAIYPEDNEGLGSWYCFSCGKGGDAIQFLREFEGMSYRDACNYLGIAPKDKDPYPSLTPIPKRNGGKPIWTPDPPGARPPDEWQEKARKFVNWAFENLMSMEPDEGIKLWLANRGINEFVIKHFGIGWNPGDKSRKDLFRPRESWGLPTEMKDGRKKKLWIPRGIVIPLLSEDRPIRILRIRIRRETGEPRYYVIPGSAMDCMVETPDNVRAYVLIESGLDARMVYFAAKNAGLPVGVVSLGNSSRKPDAITAKALRDVPVILNALDYDDAGNKQSDWWTENFPRTIRWPVPLGKDPGEAFEKGLDIAGWIKAGLPKGWFL